MKEPVVINDMARVIIVSEKGADVPPTRDGKYDAHVRIEDLPGAGKQIVVDLFNFQIRDNARAHIESQHFPPNMAGIKEANDYLQGRGFNTILAGRVEWH